MKLSKRAIDFARIDYYYDEENAKISIRCPECKKITTIIINREELWAGEKALKYGKLMQAAFPNLSDEEREVLIQGWCPDCQKLIFGDDDDDE